MLKNTIIIVFSFLISIFAKQNRTVGISSNTNNLFVKNQEVQTFSGCKDFFFLFLYNSFLEFVNIFLAGDYYYINAKTLLEDLEVDYKSDDTTIYDIRKTDKENIYKLQKRVIKK
jgi:hypothetical protein